MWISWRASSLRDKVKNVVVMDFISRVHYWVGGGFLVGLPHSYHVLFHEKNYDNNEDSFSTRASLQREGGTHTIGAISFTLTISCVNGNVYEQNPV